MILPRPIPRMKLMSTRAKAWRNRRDQSEGARGENFEAHGDASSERDPTLRTTTLWPEGQHQPRQELGVDTGLVCDEVFLVHFRENCGDQANEKVDQRGHEERPAHAVGLDEIESGQTSPGHRARLLMA